MKVCYIYHNYYPGNVPFYVHTQKLSELGCKVFVVALRRENELINELVGKVCVKRVNGFKPGDKNNLSFIRFLLSAYRILSQLEDLSIIHIGNMPGISLIPLFLRDKKCSYVLDIRSPPLHIKWRSRISNFRIRTEACFFDTTFVHSLAVGKAIFGSESKKFLELPIGVDFDHFIPGKNYALRSGLGIYPHEKVLIYSGVIRPKRNLAKMLFGFQQANKVVGNLHLIILGEGPDLNRLRYLAHEMGIYSRVHFRGFVPYSEIPVYMQAADIGLCYVPITPWFNNAPVLKTLESLASNLPTIATATQGNKEYISDGENGLLVEDSPESIASGIVKLCRRDDLHIKFQNIRDSIRKYDWNKIVKDILLSTYSNLSIKKKYRNKTQ